MDHIKADKEDLNYTNSLIESLNERLKHLSTIQNELATTLEPIKYSIHKFDEGVKKKLQTKVATI